MRSPTLRALVTLVVVFALCVFVWTLVRALWYAPDTGPAVPHPLAAQAHAVTAPTSSLPSRLIIPSLHINANVQHVGVNAAGNMRAPDNFTDVSWYEYGTVPGFRGSAVMAGHVDNGLGLDGVFKHLDQLKIGDDVYVQTNGGAMLHFIVSDIEVYPYQNVPTSLLFSRNDTARLNLITCTGSWVPGGADTYDHRIVIYTTLVQN
ncbi:MAG TPA: class F sortase [Candidatus Paceibacterota bacterium]|nr:class F sortase [Candidatus Paceibacterota bacterium]